MNWAAAMASGGCRFIYVRHEHCAVAAAMAYARSTNKVGVASVTCGPGLTQIMTALPAAVRAHIPLVIFAGEAPARAKWYNQAISQQPFVEACGAQYISLRHQHTMRTQIRGAFITANTQRCPVVIGVPADLQDDAWAEPLDALPSSAEQSPTAESLAPSKQQLDDAVNRIAQASKVVVMAGLGAVQAGAGPACEKLAEQLGALLATSLPAKGLFYQAAFSVGVAGGFSSVIARQYLQDADLIIAVGCSLASHNSDNGKLFNANNVLQIDIQPRDINHGREAAKHHLCSDAKLGVDALCQQLPKRKAGDANYWRSESIASAIRDTPSDDAYFPAEPNLLDPRDVVSVLDDLIPPSWYTVNSSGHCSCFFAQMKNRPADRFLTIREFGAIGNGVSFAMGVAAAKPTERVVLFDGDGSVLMHIQEFETLIRHGMKLLIVIINDGAYGSEIHKLRAEGLPDSGAVFGRPDFASIAEGFGASGATVTNLDDLAALIERFKNATGEPASGSQLSIIDVHVSDKVVSSVIRRSHQH